MSYRIEFRPERCVACGACAVACMDQNDLDPRAGDLPFRRCECTEQGLGAEVRMQYASIGCLHCAEAPCMQACPRGCLSRDAETGFVLCDNTQCIGCRACARVCPLDAPTFGPDGKMRKCDGCVERVKAGYRPACVAACPFDALRLEKADA